MTQYADPAPPDAGAPSVRQLLAELADLEDVLRHCPEGQRAAALDRERAILEQLHGGPADA